MESLECTWYNNYSSHIPSIVIHHRGSVQLSCNVNKDAVREATGLGLDMLTEAMVTPDVRTCDLVPRLGKKYFCRTQKKIHSRENLFSQ